MKKVIMLQPSEWIIMEKLLENAHAAAVKLRILGNFIAVRIENQMIPVHVRLDLIKFF